VTAEPLCRRLFIPNDEYLVAAISGALLELTKPYHWEQFGTVTPADAAYACLLMWIAWVNDVCEAIEPDDLSPFWDDSDAGDAEGTPTESDYTWSEQIQDWAIAAFIASSGVPGAAATYLTIAPRFRLLFRAGDTGGIAKIFLDGDLYAEVDTYSPTPMLKAFDVFVP